MTTQNTRSVTQKYKPNFELLRVPFSKVKGTCPVCGRNRRGRDWKCSVTTDGSLAICPFVPSDKTDKNGKYIHILHENNFIPSPKPKVEPTQNKIASAEKTDNVYTALLNLLPLELRHGDNLLERGLSDTTIAYKLYASTPSFNEREEIVKRLCEKLPNGDLSGVAGFYTDENAKWQIAFLSKGFYVPFRNVRGQIVGLQVRLDSPIGGSKYVWFSSADKPNGTPQKMVMHFASPDLVKQTGILIITEGALKADICAELKGCATAAIAGTGISEDRANEYAQILVKQFPELKTVQLAPDADCQENKNVSAAFLRLLNSIRKAGLTVEVITWDADTGKGIDDVLKLERKLS